MMDFYARLRTFALLAIVFRLYTDSWNDIAAAVVVAFVIGYSVLMDWSERREMRRAKRKPSNG